MISYQPSIIYVDPTVQNSPITQNILNYFPNTPVKLVEGKPDVSDIQKFSDPLLEGKKRLWITRNNGKLVKKCGASTSSLKNLICCNYYILDFSFNCHFECVYCFLQEYTNLPLMVVYANVEEMLDAVSDLIKDSTSQKIRIGTGEMADSLALDEITGFSKILVPYFAKQNKALLELKTKSNSVGNLLNLDHNGQTVIAWSMNPSHYAQKYEFKTATIEERLEAARQCQKAGYKIAFHLDPLIYEPDWKESYTTLIDRIFDEFQPSWMSLGALRFNANLRSIVQKRFPGSELVTGEFVTTPDGKKRYVRFIREEMYKGLYEYILSKQSNTPIYLCMEHDVVWEKSLGYRPSSEQGLEAHIVQLK